MESWEVEATDEFVDWWRGLTADQQESIADRVDLLAERGPDLGRPIVDRIQTSRHHNMKELRWSVKTRRGSGTPGTSGPYRPPTISSMPTWPSYVMRG